MDAIAKSKKAHDAERQSRAVLVRLSEEEAAAVDRLKHKDETRAGYLRRLHQENAAKSRRKR